jgi:hypothetical protein
MEKLKENLEFHISNLKDSKDSIIENLMYQDGAISPNLAYNKTVAFYQYILSNLDLADDDNVLSNGIFDCQTTTKEIYKYGSFPIRYFFEPIEEEEDLVTTNKRMFEFLYDILAEEINTTGLLFVFAEYAEPDSKNAEMVEYLRERLKEILDPDDYRVEIHSTLYNYISEKCFDHILEPFTDQTDPNNEEPDLPYEILVHGTEILNLITKGTGYSTEELLNTDISDPILLDTLFEAPLHFFGDYSRGILAELLKNYQVYDIEEFYNKFKNVYAEKYKNYESDSHEFITIQKIKKLIEGYLSS